MVIIALSVCLGILTLVVVSLGLLMWSRHHKLRTRWADLDVEGARDELPRMAAGLCLGVCSEGNEINLLRNGDGFLPSLVDAIDNAEHSVHFETFLWKTGDASRRLVEAFCRRARAGAKVRVLVDAVGSRTMEPPERHALREAGVKLAFYNEHRLANIGTFNTRDHRKIAVVDGRIGFIGGHCVTDDWLGDARSRAEFRDTSVRVRGPIVAQLQAAFSENWTEVTGELLAAGALFPTNESCGQAVAHLAYVNFGRRVSAVKVLHYLAIESAQERLTIQNPYFLPYHGATRALCRAVARGVRVRLMIPTLASSDNKLVQHAVHHGLRPLLEGGIEVYGYGRTLLHQKVLAVDGKWVVVGSANFDDRSFEINEEISLSIFDDEVARKIEDDFEQDLLHTERVTLEEWNARGWGHRICDWAAWQIRSQL